MLLTWQAWFLLYGVHHFQKAKRRADLTYTYVSHAAGQQRKSSKISDHPLAWSCRPAVGVCPFGAGCRTTETANKYDVDPRSSRTVLDANMASPLAPRSSPLALLPVSQSTWLRPSARVPTPDRANGTYASPLEDCSGSRLKLLVLRVPPSVWHRGSNLGLVSTSFGPMGWSGICVAGYHRASIPHSRRPFPWCGQPRSRPIEHWVVVESKFGMSWQSILPRAILDPSQAAYLFLSIHSTADSHAPVCARLHSRWFGTITAWLLEGRSDHCWLVGAPRTPPSDKLSWIYCGLQECLYASRQPSSPSSFRSHSIHLPANLH